MYLFSGLDVFREIITVFEDNYPEMLKKTYIINGRFYVQSAFTRMYSGTEIQSHHVLNHELQSGILSRSYMCCDSTLFLLMAVHVPIPVCIFFL